MAHLLIYIQLWFTCENKKLFVGWSLLEVIHHFFAYGDFVVAALLQEFGKLTDDCCGLLHEQEGEDEKSINTSLSIFEADGAHIDQEKAEVSLLNDKQSQFFQGLNIQLLLFSTQYVFERLGPLELRNLGQIYTFH